MTEHKLIGYLIPTAEFFVVHCVFDAEDKRVPVFDINVKPYRQTCQVCGTVLAGSADPSVPELFNGRKR